MLAVHFSDEAGRRVERPGFSLETRFDVSFEEKDGRTKVTIRQTGPVADQGESEGWRQGLERLAQVLSKN
jgi:hypothetical protein